MFDLTLFNFFKKNKKNSNNINGWLQNTRFKDIIYHSTVPTYICNEEGKIVFYNQSAINFLTIEPEIDKDLWTNLFKVVSNDDSLTEITNSPMVITLEKGTTFLNEELTIKLKNQSIKQILYTAHPIFNINNEIIGSYNTITDISKKKSSLDKQNILSSIVSSSADAIISKDNNGIINSWNSGAQRIFGYTEEEVLGHHITILIPKEKLEEEKIILEKIKKGEIINQLQTVRLHKTGRNIHLSVTISPLNDNFNNIIGASKIARDISDLVETQTQLKKHIDNLEILNSIGKLISEKLDINTVLQRVTDATTKITGAAFGAFFYNTIDKNDEKLLLYTLSGAPKESFEKLGKPTHTTLFKPTFLHKEIIRVDDVTKDPRYGTNGEHKGVPKGHLPIISYMSVPVVSPDGEIIGGLLFGHHKVGVFTEHHEGIISSIASQAAVALENAKLLQEVTTLSEKKDEFITTASHELKTPLTTIKGYLQLHKKNNGNTIFTEKALEQVNRLDTLIAELLNITKMETGKLEFNLETLDISSLIDNIIKEYTFSHKSHTITYNKPENPILVKVDKLRIEQVLKDILTNAIEYSPDATKVDLELNKTEEDISIAIKDQGIGLDEIQLKNIFKKFYRAGTIENISGLGLSLYQAKEIIKKHQGKITVKSELGKGTEFNITLPNLK